MADEDRLTPPFDSDGLARTHARDVEFRGCHGQHVRGCGHGRYELDDEYARRGRVRESDAGEEEVGEGASFRFGDAIDSVVGVTVIDGAELVEGG